MLFLAFPSAWIHPTVSSSHHAYMSSKKCMQHTCTYVWSSAHLPHQFQVNVQTRETNNSIGLIRSSEVSCLEVICIVRFEIISGATLRWRCALQSVLVDAFVQWYGDCWCTCADIPYHIMVCTSQWDYSSLRSVNRWYCSVIGNDDYHRLRTMISVHSGTHNKLDKSLLGHIASDGVYIWSIHRYNDPIKFWITFDWFLHEDYIVLTNGQGENYSGLCTVAHMTPTVGMCPRTCWSWRSWGGHRTESYTRWYNATRTMLCTL